jgi:hypothetical protein
MGAAVNNDIRIVRNNLYVEPTSSCNLDCRRCYATSLTRSITQDANQPPQSQSERSARCGVAGKPQVGGAVEAVARRLVERHKPEYRIVLRIIKRVYELNKASWSLETGPHCPGQVQ